MQDIIFFGDKGLPAKPKRALIWAAEKVNEYQYRQLFHLSKAEMMQEPLEDVIINSKITELIAYKEKREARKQEMKSKHGRR